MVCSTEYAMPGYETFMLAENSIPGLLPARISNADDKLQFWYDISGKQAFEDWIKMKEAGSILLRKLITSLAETVVQAGEYLLCEDGISLQPGHIFVDMEEKEIVFCYLPFGKTPFDEALQSFMEYYLSHMDHENRAGMQKCYDVYEKCRQGHVDLEGLLAILYCEKGQTEGMVQEQKGQGGNGAVEKAAVLTKAAATVSPKGAVKNHVFQRASQKKWLMPPFFSRKKKQHFRACSYEPREYAKEHAYPTVFLGSETSQMLGELKYEGEGVGMNFPITTDVYLIGSQDGEVDGIIPDKTVSRIHARITKEEDSFYLEDMNSTNGTYRNGELLNYKERVKLQKNDKVAFAQVCYRFV